MITLPGGLYDYPAYYDLVFGSDWQAEYAFLEACFRRYARRPVRRVFEPACGTGRLLYRLGQAGYEVSGLDLNPRAVDYCNRRLRRRALPPTARVGDMARFRLPRPADAAFNMINSFRHLLTEAAAASHLQCVARGLARGGVYVLGLHLTPTAGKPMEEESWTARRGWLAVRTHMRTIRRDLRRRRERLRMVCTVHTPRRTARIAEEMVFRTYTLPQFRRLLRRVPELETAGIHDFAYDIDQPVRPGPETEDAVFVLRKR